METEDTIFWRGFLSTEVEKYRERYRRDFAKKFSECEFRSHVATATLYSADITPLSDPSRKHELLALGFWCRCLSACQGAILLAERGMALEAGALLRSALEFLFIGAALLVDREVFDRLIDGDQYARLEQARAMLKDGQKVGSLQAEQISQLNELIGEYGNAKRGIDAYSAADKAGFAYLYSTIYRGMSFVSSHATLASTNSVFEIDDEGNPLLAFGPSPANIEFIVEMIEICLAAGADRFSPLLKPQVKGDDE